MPYKTPAEIDAAMATVGANVEGVRATIIDDLVWTAVFGESDAVKAHARTTIRTLADQLGCPPRSIHDVYMAMGRGEVSGFTVPAVNIRGLTYDVARAMFRAARPLNVGAMIFEIARTEIGYTDQRPDEYVVCILAAAIKEGHHGPIFIQGDHVQVNAKKYADVAQRDAEMDSLRKLIKEELAAGFYNIDVDTSTLVDLSKATLAEQQELNSRLCAEFTRYIRANEPKGITVSVGGEIGEVGEKNSTTEELVAFMDEYKKFLDTGGPGISKISVQTGTSHGGVPLADGTVAQVALDFATLGKLSEVAKNQYGLSGAVQHGASTLPAEAFHRFPELKTSEIHLATGFQNMIYDHPKLPAAFKEKVYAHLRESAAADRKPTDSEQQFIYKARKKGFGPFKQEWWSLPNDVKGPIMADLEKEFSFLYEKLGVVNSLDAVRKYVPTGK